MPKVSGLAGNDTVTGLSEVYSDPNARGNKTLSVSAYTVGDGNNGKNYTIITVSDTTGTITRATLTITATSNTKTYDSTTTAAAIPTVSGLQGNDTATGLAEVYSDGNAGINKMLNVSAYTVDNRIDYTVTVVSDFSGLINRAPLTITATSNTKSYDSTTNAAATPTVSGLFGNDTVGGLSESFTAQPTLEPITR